MDLKEILKSNKNIHKNSFMLDDVLDAVKLKKKEQKEKKSIKDDLRRFNNHEKSVNS